MPVPGKNEKHDDFIKRCIPYVINEGTAKDGSQGKAICESIWKKHKSKKKNNEYEEFSFTVQMFTKEQKIELDCKDCNEQQYEIKKNHAVALIGDAFYHGAFLPAEELEKSYKGWENTLHDINHQGTTDVKGFFATSNILYFVGYNDNVTYNPETKAMEMDIHIVDKTHYASAWRGYVELCEKAGQVPNVSVAFLAKTKQVKASDLPEGVDYKACGYGEEDTVTYIYDIRPQALSTVFRGACDDKQGCGIGKSCSEDEEVTQEEQKNVTEEINDEEKQAIIKWLKEHE